MVKPSHIITPNYKEADLICLDLSGTQLVFRLPMHEGSFEALISESQIDLHEMFGKFPEDAHKYSKFITLVQQLWTYKSAITPFDAGRVIFSAKISEVSVSPDSSLLCLTTFLNSTIDAFSDIFGEYDREVEDEFKMLGSTPSQDDMWVYPKKADDLKAYQNNLTTWRICRTGHPGAPPLAFWVGTPIDPTHILVLNFSFSGFQEKDIGPGICRDELMEAYVKDFLEHFHIQYSPETLAEMEQYK
ncbi:hypothetical protein [Hahella sp. NBU794]|uniref:hypothetical protein n=1 Tax=Hahella sp. NBU794 TaxID=3422590 RepID=UPI003D6F5F2A